MTVRITIIDKPGIRLIAVDGRLSKDEVGELERVIGDDVAGVRLELGNLRSADAAGFAVLRRLRAQGVEMRGVPPHLAWRIEGNED